MGQKMKNELEKAFEDKFYCPAKFAQEIEHMVQTHEDMNVDVDIGLRNNCTAGVERICI